jgi:RNA polymerase sigma factor (TIGR02999 family)
MSDDAAQVTQILDAVERGDEGATDGLLSIVYDELRQIAARQMSRERPDHTLQATALVHEAFLRLGGDGVSWESRRHFFGAAGEAMRRILVDHARARGRERRGGGRARVELEPAEIAVSGRRNEKDLDYVAIDEALRRMEGEDPRTAEVVKLRYFAGLGLDETARAMGLSERTVSRLWRTARAWLGAQITGDV